MREEIENQEKAKTGAGRKVLVAFGLLFLSVGIFLTSLACTFHLMNQEEEAVVEVDENSLENENQKLKEEIQILTEQVDILESELEKYEGTARKATPAQLAGQSSGSTREEESSTEGSTSKSNNEKSSTTHNSPTIME